VRDYWLPPLLEPKFTLAFAETAVADLLFDAMPVFIDAVWMPAKF
jgi:hypothetical protein